MPDSETRRPHPDFVRARWCTWGLRLVLGVFIAALLAQVSLRCAFPWDLFVWSESPFMTDMLKLELGRPVFGPPEDANSFVYSPGLTYLTWAVLKPLGLHLDIRFCRVVVVLLGLAAALMAGMVAKRALQFIIPDLEFRGLGWMSAALAALVIFKNLTADAVHPDNLAILHATGLLWLTLRAVQRASMPWAVAAMLFAALGMLAKQTLCLSVVGPAIVFMLFRPWGWRGAVGLAGIGLVASATVLAVLWWGEHARFYTWEILSTHKVKLRRCYWMLMDLLHADRALLAVLGLTGVVLLWQMGQSSRRYLHIWLALGVFSVAPASIAYLKQFGTWNNLIIFQLWLLILALPSLGIWFGRMGAHKSPLRDPFSVVLGVLFSIFVLALAPIRVPPNQSMYETCSQIQQRVTEDIAAGRRILIAHGTMYQLKAGSHEVPLDRANSVLELVAAGLGDRAHTVERIRSGYYDRIYLTLETWYGEAIQSAIRQNYVMDESIPMPLGLNHAEFGRWLELIGDCKILSLRPAHSESTASR